MNNEPKKDSQFFPLTLPSLNFKNQLSGEKPFAKTLPISRKDEALSLAELLQKQAQALGKTKSQPTLWEQIKESQRDFAKRAKDKLSVELELLLQRNQITVDVDRLEHSTNKQFLEPNDFVKILKIYGVFDIFSAKLNYIQSVLKEDNGTINFSGFIDCLKKAQAVPSFILPKQNLITPIEPLVSWSLPPLPPIYGQNEGKIDRWTEKEWENYYFEENQEDEDED